MEKHTGFSKWNKDIRKPPFKSYVFEKKSLYFFLKAQQGKSRLVGKEG